MQQSVSQAMAALTIGSDAARHFDLAADRIQRALLDVTFERIDGVDIGVHAEPARLVGGDYIDLFASRDGVLAFGLGDASGKSLAAALNAMMLKYLVRGLITALGTDDLIPHVTHTNTVVSDDMVDGSFITFLLGALNPRDGLLRVVNAGHEPALIARAATGTIEVMEPAGIVLGIQPANTYREQTTRLAPGDVAIFYTDGLTEASNSRGELFTVERLKETLLEYRGLDAKALADALFDTIKIYGSGELRDDATVLVLRLTESATH